MIRNFLNTIPVASRGQASSTARLQDTLSQTHRGAAVAARHANPPIHRHRTELLADSGGFLFVTTKVPSSSGNGKNSTLNILDVYRVCEGKEIDDMYSTKQ